MNLKQKIWNIRQRYLSQGSVKNSYFFPIIKKYIPDNAITILDVGCGKVQDDPKEDFISTLFSNPNYLITGIDGFAENIIWRKENNLGSFIRMDIRDAKTLGKFDIVICNHTIEHLVKEESIKLVDDLESMAIQLLVIGTPIGFINADYNVLLHNNPLEAHKCGWLPDEFEQRGYKTFSKKQSFIAIKKR